MNTTHPVDQKILGKIYTHGRGSVFTPNDFLRYGSRDAVDKALERIRPTGPLRRLSRGIYDYPRLHPELGLLYPSPEAVAKAIVRGSGSRLLASGAYAANLLGLSTQVPAKIVFLTDGKSRKIQLGKTFIELKQATPKVMATAGKTSGLVIQAFKFIGKENINPIKIKKLRQQLSAADKKQLLKDIVHTPAWMHHFFREIASET